MTKKEIIEKIKNYDLDVSGLEKLTKADLEKILKDFRNEIITVEKDLEAEKEFEASKSKDKIVFINSLGEIKKEVTGWSKKEITEYTKKTGYKIR